MMDALLNIIKKTAIISPVKLIGLKSNSLSKANIYKLQKRDFMYVCDCAYDDDCSDWNNCVTNCSYDCDDCDYYGRCNSVCDYDCDDCDCDYDCDDCDCDYDDCREVDPKEEYFRHIDDPEYYDEDGNYILDD